jgi:hypothetical protein
MSLNDDNAWSKLIWFGSEHGIFHPSMMAGAGDFRTHLAYAFHQSATEFLENPKDCLLAWDTVDKTFLVILPIYLTSHNVAEMAIGFRFFTNPASRVTVIEPASIRLFSLPEALLRAHVVRPVEDCWLTRAILNNRLN